MAKLGAPKTFSNDKMNAEDEGELMLAIAVDHGRIIVQFGKSVSWLGLGHREAIEIATTLIDAAMQLSGEDKPRPRQKAAGAFLC